LSSGSEEHKPITLYTSLDSQYCHRVRYVLEEKKLKPDRVEIESGEVNEDLIEINSTGSLPTLLDRDTKLYNSMVIMEYLEERYPSPPLMPAFPSPRAEARIMMREMDRELSDNAEVLAHRSKNTKQYETAKETLRRYAVHLSMILGDRKFFLDSGISLVDCCAVPVLWRLKMLGISLPARTTRSLRLYMERMFAREAFLESMTVDEEEMNEL